MGCSGFEFVKGNVLSHQGSLYFCAKHKMKMRMGMKMRMNWKRSRKKGKRALKQWLAVEIGGEDFTHVIEKGAHGLEGGDNVV